MRVASQPAGRWPLCEPMLVERLRLHADAADILDSRKGVMRIFKISDAATIDHVKAADADVQAAYDALKVADESALGSLQKRLNDANAAINTAVVTAHVAKHAVGGEAERSCVLWLFICSLAVCASPEVREAEE